MKAKGLKKGILKHGSNEMINLRPCDSMETSFCDETVGSDAENPNPSHSGEGVLQCETSTGASFIPVLHCDLIQCLHEGMRFHSAFT